MIRACLDADRVLVVAAAMADRLAAVGVSAERISIVPMGVDAERFAPQPREDARRRVGAPDGPLLLFVGRATEAKGIHVLGEALRLLGEGAPACVALGPTGAAVPGIDQRGVAPQEAVAAWLSAADLLCLPSFGEGTPLSVSEALACGTPVVASAVGGIPEQIREGVNGALVAPGDPRALADAIAKALSVPWSRDRIRESSRELWLDRSAGRVVEIYDELLRGSPVG
jgi:glycosyltransferase involved in cell wall biosynthesis